MRDVIFIEEGQGITKLEEREDIDYPVPEIQVELILDNKFVS